MADEGFKRKLAAILSADVEGYSRLMDDDEEATVRTLTSYRTAIADLAQQFRGRIVDTPGDNILAEFTSVVDAVNCAVEIQRDLAERNAEQPYNRKMEFRIGINLGDVIEEEGRIYGDGVNIAARMESMAEAGGICISGRAYDQVANKLGLEYENLGEHQVKNINTPIRVYRVLSYPGAAAYRVVKAKRAVAKTWRRAAYAVAGILVVVGGFTIWNFVFRTDLPSKTAISEEPSESALDEKPAIAVLPFVNMSDDPKQEYFSDGITNDVITDLSRFSNLFVIASNSVFTYKGKPVKVKEVGRDLGVRYVLEGSVQKVGDQVRINAQLIDAKSDHHLWAKRYDLKLNDIFAVQDEITKAIVTALEVILTENELEQEIHRYTDVIEAYDLFLRGRTYLQGTKQTHLKARKLFDQAIELDPNFAAAYAEKSFTYFSSFIMPMSRNKKVIKAAVKTAEQAVALDDSLPLAYARLGWAYFAARRHKEAMTKGRRAVALGPNDAESHAQLGNLMNWTGNPEEGIVLIKKAMRLNPNYPYYYLFYLGHSHYLMGNND